MPVWLFRRLECRRMQLGDQKYCCFSNSRTASFALSISGYLTDVNVRLMFNLWFCLNIIRDLPPSIPLPPTLPAAANRSGGLCSSRMKHIRGLVSTAQALRRSLLPLEFTRAPFVKYNVPLRQAQLRFLKYSRSTTDAGPPAKPGPIKDEDIPADIVQVVNENGGLDPPVQKADVLRSLQRPEYSLVQVAPATADRPPVCKILSRRVMWEQERAKAKAAHAAKTSLKQIELNWAIDNHDLSHRLKQLVAFLDKGVKVEIILTRKRGKRAPTPEEVKNLMDNVLATIEEANAIQVKAMEGEPGKHVLMTVKKKDA